MEIRVGNPSTGSLVFSKLTYNVSISEDSHQGDTVTSVAASGASAITYSFNSGNEHNIFNINPSSGTITVNSASKLDYETTPVLRLIILATGGNRYAYATVYVYLEDANDNAPSFSQERYVSSVWEGNPRGTYVTQIRANDADAGNNGRITYSIISGNTQDAFLIEPAYSGIIKTNIILDREIIDVYRLELEAIDGGYPPRTSNCILRIQVIDVNDNTPFFPQTDHVTISEGMSLPIFTLQSI